MICRFGDLGEIFDGPHATPKRVDAGPYFLNIASLRDGRLDLSESDHVSSTDFVRWTRRVTPREGDLLFSYETRLGEAALMPADVEACLGRRMALLRPDRAAVDPRFLLYYYVSPSFKRIIEEHTIHGATVNRIPLSTMGNWKLSIPAIEVQRAIAEVLGALDDKIAANTALARTADELARARFQQAVDTSTMSTASVGDLVAAGALTVGDGYRTKRSELADSGFRIVRVADVRGGQIYLDSSDFVAPSYERAIGAKAGLAGDIVLTTKGTIGRVAVLPQEIEPIVYSPQLCFFRVSDGNTRLDAHYLHYWLLGPEFAEQAGHRMNNSDMAPYINLADIRSLRIGLPDLPTQLKLGSALGALDVQIASSQRESLALSATRDALLPALMSGRLRVGEAEAAAEAIL